jgi:hypothetical protein
VGNNDILVVCEGDNTLPMNDNSGVMRSDGGSDTQFCFFFETILELVNRHCMRNNSRNIELHFVPVEC